MRFPLPRLSTASILSSLAMLLAGCATLPGTPDVDLKAALEACQQLDPKVPGPGPNIHRGSDYRDLSPEALAALKKANEGTARRNACEAKVIAKYANPGAH